MATYGSAIAATGALTNNRASQSALDAPGIAAGAVRTLSDVSNAMDELKQRKRLKETIVVGQPPNLTAAVTSDEVARSAIRMHAVVSEAVATTYPNAGVPQWGQTLQTDVTALQTDVTALQTSVTALHAFIRNMAARKRNEKVMAPNGPLNLVPIRKEEPDTGLQLYGHGTYAGTPTLNDVPGFFPRNCSNLNSLTKANVADLSMFYNDDFGILQNDGVAQWRIKLRSFISE